MAEPPDEERGRVQSTDVGFILGGYDSNATSEFRVLHWGSPELQREERADVLVDDSIMA